MKRFIHKLLPFLIISPALLFGQANSTIDAKQVAGPKIDIMNRQFGAPARCANPADPTGVNDSYCALQAAINYAASSPFDPAATPSHPQVYLPAGHYKLSQSLRVPLMVDLVGDGENSTFLDPVPGSTNGAITVIPVGPWPAFISGATTVRDLYVEGHGNANTADAVEIYNIQNFHITRVGVGNWGGRAFNCVGNCERGSFVDDQTDLSRMSYNSSYQSNEIRFFNFQIMFPGNAKDGYCWNVNCKYNAKNPGHFPDANSGTLSTLKWTANTPVQQGTVIADSNGNNEYARISGVTGQTPPAWNKTPGKETNDGTSDNSCSVNGGGGPTCAVTWVNVANWTPVLPDHHPVVHVMGQNYSFNGGSWKGLVLLSGLKASGGEVHATNLYLEAPSWDGRPTNDSSVIVGQGESEQSLCSAPFSAADTVLPCPDNGWFSSFINLPSDAATFNSPFDLYLIPHDFEIGNHSHSQGESDPRIMRDSYEKLTVLAFAGDGKVYLPRNGRCKPGSTYCGAWNHAIIMEADGIGGGKPVLDSLHLTAVQGANGAFGGPGYYSACSDTNYVTLPDGTTRSAICSEILLGGLPEGRAFGTLNSPGIFEPGYRAHAEVELNGGTFWGMPVHEVNGVGTIKIPLFGAVTDYNSARSPAIPNGADTTTDGEVMPAVVFSRSPVGNKQAGGQVDRPALGTHLSVGHGKFLDATAVANSPIIGRYFTNEYDWLDINPGSKGGSSNRFRILGGPNNAGGIELDKWDGHSWIKVFGVDHNGSLTTSGIPIFNQGVASRTVTAPSDTVTYADRFVSVNAPARGTAESLPACATPFSGYPNGIGFKVSIINVSSNPVSVQKNSPRDNIYANGNHSGSVNIPENSSLTLTCFSVNGGAASWIATSD